MSSIEIQGLYLPTTRRTINLLLLGDIKQIGDSSFRVRGRVESCEAIDNNTEDNIPVKGSELSLFLSKNFSRVICNDKVYSYRPEKPNDNINIIGVTTSLPEQKYIQCQYHNYDHSFLMFEDRLMKFDGNKWKNVDTNFESLYVPQKLNVIVSNGGHIWPDMPDFVICDNRDRSDVYIDTHYSYNLRSKIKSLTSHHPAEDCLIIETGDETLVEDVEKDWGCKVLAVRLNDGEKTHQKADKMAFGDIVMNYNRYNHIKNRFWYKPTNDTISSRFIVK